MAKKFIDADLAPIYLNSAACEQIKYMPTADVQEVRYGKWIEHNGEWFYDTAHECSFCGYGCNEDFDYCPNCGARMDGEENDKC